MRELLHAAIQVRGVLAPVATKVIHRKRRALIPMLDSVVLRHYLSVPELRGLLPGTEDKRRAASVATEALKCFRADLLAASSEIESVKAQLTARGYPLTPVRIVELLVWTQMEPQGYYRLR